jgi:transcriptional regulator with XRE-family HTH domain
LELDHEWSEKMSPKRVKKSQGNDPVGEKRKVILKKEIGKRLRKVRKTLGYTQDQMVGYFDCGRANYSRIEKGEVFPNPGMLEVLYNQFNVSLHWLICSKGAMMQAQPENTQPETGNPVKGIDTSEVRELLFYIETVPMIKHAVLGFFLEYKEENKKLIAPFISNNPESTSKI